jgi:hypothetical protein
MGATGGRLRSPVLFVTARRLKTLAAQSRRPWDTENPSTSCRKGGQADRHRACEASESSGMFARGGASLGFSTG